MNYNRAIKTARLISGKKLIEMANIIGVDKSMLSRIERGQRKVSMELFARVSKELNIPEDIMVFLAAETEDLQSIPEKEMGKLGRFLIKTLTRNS